jgi:pimeloyl-ACP methyl ester carboxylesterase
MGARHPGHAMRRSGRMPNSGLSRLRWILLADQRIWSGNSYGGTVALNAARRFPRQVASLTLIEPVAFHLLRHADEPDGWREIAALAVRHLALVGEGRDAAAAEAFVTYWTGRKGWQQMPDAARDNAVRAAAKVAAEWRLMFASEDDRDAITGIGAPTLLICGGRTRTPARRLVEVLRRALPHALHHEIADAGHMSPLTHASEVSALIVRHIVDAAADGRWRPQSLADIPGAAARRAEAAS